jgi:hypothetical protein
MTQRVTFKDILDRLTKARRGRYRNDVERAEVMAVEVEDALVSLLEVLSQPRNAEIVGK